MTTEPLSDGNLPEPRIEAVNETSADLAELRNERVPPPVLELGEDENGQRTITIQGKDGALAAVQALASTGLRNTDALGLLLHQFAVINPTAFDRGDTSHTNSALSMLDELEPKGGAQTMLATQMVAIHVAAMACLSRATISNQTFEGRDLNLKHGMKLAGLYARQAETLSKLKRKGQQTVNVRHVHVHDGGQAVVGNLRTGD